MDHQVDSGVFLVDGLRWKYDLWLKRQVWGMLQKLNTPDVWPNQFSSMIPLSHTGVMQVIKMQPLKDQETEVFIMDAGYSTQRLQRKLRGEGPTKKSDTDKADLCACLIKTSESGLIKRP